MTVLDILKITDPRKKVSFIDIDGVISETTHPTQAMRNMESIHGKEVVSINPLDHLLLITWK